MIEKFLQHIQHIVDDWMLIDNSGEPYELIAERKKLKETIYNPKIREKLKSKYDGK